MEKMAGTGKENAGIHGHYPGKRCVWGKSQTFRETLEESVFKRKPPEELKKARG